MTERLPLTPHTPLTIDAHLPAIAAALAMHRAVVVTAAPGAGKTTRVPPALAGDGPVLLLQPRRVAARSIARRIAEERRWTIGREVGWQVRFERNFTNDTRLIVATEGVLTARLQQDPLAGAFRTIVIDEFHERSIHADVGLALAREAWRARPDLRLVIMSATIDAARVAAYLDGCPIIAVPGRLFPLDVSYLPGVAMEDAVVQAVRGMTGALLCFLPGAPEIRRTAERLAGRAALRGMPVLPLHGSLDADEQDAVLRPSSGPRVILATNLAETTVTVPDVSTVIDSGLHKVARYDADRAIDSLEIERIAQDSADQRAGRAGRVQAGRAMRLWDARDRLRVHREPEIVRVDLASTVLDVIAWGGDPRTLGWFETPPAPALDAAIELLERLGALDREARLTALGASLRRLPLHPRLARMLMATADSGRTTTSGVVSPMARACAWLSERHSAAVRGGRSATSCDLLAAIEPGRLPSHVERAAAQIQLAAVNTSAGTLSEDDFRRAVLAGYPDRVGRRRPGSTDRFLLASGVGARLGRESGVIGHEFIVAVDVTGGEATGADALIRTATGIDREWLSPTSKGIRHEFDSAAGVVRAHVVEMYDALVLTERPIAPDPIEAGRILGVEYERRGPSAVDTALLRRLAFAGVTIGFAELVAAGAAGKSRLAEVDLEGALPHDVRQTLERHAPAVIAAPSGRAVALEYRDGGIVAAAVKLQELFGLADSPRVGRARVPVTFELLSPAGRPVQVTNDLRSFWTRGYPEVRKELRARYPKHPWPEDPWTATPTHRTIRRSPR